MCCLDGGILNNHPFVSYVATNTPETCLISDRCGEGCPTCENDDEGDSVTKNKSVENEIKTPGSILEKQTISGK